MVQSDQTSAKDQSAVLRTLLITDLVNSTKLLEELGDKRAFEIFGLHDRIARDLLPRFSGREIDKTDGFLLLFDRPIDALGYSLAYHRALDELSKTEEVDLAARAGIHLGEVWVRENAPEDIARGAKPLEVEGLAKPMAARLMSLAKGRQTLVTRGAYDLAKRAAVDLKESRLSWCSHGAYAFKGVDEPIRVYEIGEEGFAPLERPPDSAKVWRVTRSGKPVAKARRRVPLIIGGVAALIIAVLGVVFMQQSTSIDDRLTVAVLGFKNVKGDQDAEWLSTALVESLSAELASGGQLRTVSGEAISRARRDLGIASVQTLAEDTLTLLHKRLGADLFVAGSFLKVGSGINLSIWAQDADTGEQTATVNEQGTEDEFFQLAANSSRALREQFGLAVDEDEHTTSMASFPTTASGTKLYAQGLEALRASDPQTAANLLQQAVALEADSPLVHQALANAWRALGLDESARTEATLAWELVSASDTISREQRLQVEARYAETLGKWADAVASYQELFKFDPHNLAYGIKLAAVQVSAAQGEEALITIARLRDLGEDPLIDYHEARALRSLSRYEEQLEAARRTIDNATELQATQLTARGHILAGQALSKMGQDQEGMSSFLQARRLFEKSGNRARLAQSINLLATRFLRMGDASAARGLFQESLEISRSLGDRKGTASALGNLAIVKRRGGDLAGAARDFEELIGLYQDVGNVAYEAVTRSNLAGVYVDQGRLDEAQQLYNEALAAFEKIGRRSSYCNTLRSIGELLLIRGDPEGAAARHQEALGIAEELGQAGLAAEIRRELAASWLELALFDEAAVEADAAASFFAETDKRDDEGLARAILAEARLARGDQPAAEAEIVTALSLISGSGNTRVIDRVHLAEARVLLVAGKNEEALSLLLEICDQEASQRSMLCLDSQVVAQRSGLGKIQKIMSLEEIEREAEASGFGLVLRHLRASR